MKITDKLVIPDPKLMTFKEGRIEATKHNPLLFAHYYLSDHITSATDGSISLAEFHAAIVDYAKSWSSGSTGERTTFIAPRAVGKSTWIFLILPMWAAAHGHQDFIAAFSDSANQAEMHLATFKTELQSNEKLNADFPDLCTPKMGKYRDRVETFNRSEIIMQNGFIFMARGADTSALGMKVGSKRPSLIILDDIEPGEAKYSEEVIKNRLKTLLDDIFPLNQFANVALVGTTTKQGSIIDQVRRVSVMRQEWEGSTEDFREQLSADLRWVVDERIGCHYFPALLDEGTDKERSVWPEKWSLELLMSMRHTRSFAKNYMCSPISEDASYWSESDIDIEYLEEYGNTILSVDPAVTTNKKSDYTGLAVISRGLKENADKVYVRHIEEVKLSPEELRNRVIELIEQFKVKVVLVETNMGGDLWSQLFSNLRARFRFERTSIKKEIRASRALDWYQKDKVKHVAFFPAAEEQLKNFPNVIHDDMVDAISAGVNYFMGSKGSSQISATIVKYNKEIN